MANLIYKVTGYKITGFTKANNLGILQGGGDETLALSQLYVKLSIDVLNLNLVKVIVLVNYLD